MENKDETTTKDGLGLIHIYTGGGKGKTTASLDRHRPATCPGCLERAGNDVQLKDRNLCDRDGCSHLGYLGHADHQRQ